MKKAFLVGSYIYGTVIGILAANAYMRELGATWFWPYILYIALGIFFSVSIIPNGDESGMAIKSIIAIIFTKVIADFFLFRLSIWAYVLFKGAIWLIIWILKILL